MYPAPKPDDDRPEIVATVNTVGTRPQPQLPIAREIHTPLAYQIPQQDLRNAFLASKTSGAAFWKHSLYKSPIGERITVYYCTKFEQAEKQAKLFLNETVIGFDAEWESGSKMETSSIKENMSLIQIASEDRIALFQIASFYGDTADALMPPSLKKILESPDIIKAGVNIAGDYTRLRKCFGIQGQGLFELSHLYKVVKYSEKEPTKVDRKPAKMADQVEDCLFLPLAKGAVRTSAWSRRLSAEQVEYAASDAYAGFRLYDALEARRKAMVPTPPRPALYELQMPLILGNGLPPPRKKKASATTKPNIHPGETASSVQTVVLEDTEDEGRAAAEVLDEIHDEGEEAKESEDEFYSCESDYEESPPGQPEHGSLTSEPTSSPPDTAQELVLADEWLRQWRERSVADRKPRATPACLRAYALWHSQTLGIDMCAKILRNPPLALTSVAQYVLEAVKVENLPYTPDRLREVVGFLHPSAQWRYTRLMDKLRKMDGGGL